MNTVINETTAPAAATAPAMTAPATSHAPRMELYTGIHKALRCAMADSLLRLGRLDVADDGERTLVIGQLEEVLGLLRGHLEHENYFLHTAIEARRPGGARQTAEDHAGHLDALCNLEDEVHALRSAGAAQRDALALRLYRHLAHFVGENLLHMQVEESSNQSLLWQLYDDAELAEIHGRLVASIPPHEMGTIARWMAQALSPQELIALFKGMQAEAPPEVVRALLDVARPHMSLVRWAKLARGLGIAPVPGLVTV
jgi:hypothetical protein